MKMRGSADVIVMRAIRSRICPAEWWKCAAIKTDGFEERGKA